MIVVLDLNMGNPGSIINMLKKIGVTAKLSSKDTDLAAASKLVLPGVGAFDAGMASLERAGVIPRLTERVRAGVPTLGICLGMQLLTRRSDEGQRPGLGFIDADVVRFRPTEPTVKVPHMGWNEVQAVRRTPLVDDLPENARFYFVHSYFTRCDDDGDILLTAHHGASFCAAFQHRNVMGVQFHPEKSHRFGMTLLRSFATKVV
jgi:glutamine amidotransferase